MVLDGGSIKINDLEPRLSTKGFHWQHMGYWPSLDLVMQGWMDVRCMGCSFLGLIAHTSDIHHHRRLLFVPLCSHLCIFLQDIKVHNSPFYPKMLPNVLLPGSEKNQSVYSNFIPTYIHLIASSLLLRGSL